MLTHLKIKDFQSISELELEFGRYTTIVGRSNSGKSAILRALHVLSRNSFVPSYVRAGQSNTFIEATMDGERVSTIRGTESTYTYIDEEGSMEVYAKCARAVPEAVERFLVMPLVADEDVFFTNQFELPFLVAGKATRASAVMGTLTNAVLVNSLAQETNRVRLNIKQKITVRNEDLDRLESERQQFGDLPHLVGSLARVKMLHYKYLHVVQTHHELSRAIRDMEAVSFVEVPWVPSVDEPLTQLKEADGTVRDLRRSVRRAEDIALVTVPPAPKVSDDQWADLATYTQTYLELNRMLEIVINQKEKYTQSLEELERVDSEIHRVEKHLGTFDVCETCGQVLS